MLSIEKLRKIDKSLKRLPDKDVAAIRDAFYEAAQLMFDTYWEKKYGSKDNLGLFTKNSKDTIV
tara:strand:- start:111935 stop:112126 length:192 start_codon:yes stop_codon:yes gene_type:complete